MILKISGNQISCLFFLKRARLVESYKGSGLNGSCASLGLFIRSTWMALFVYHAFVLEWGVGRMAINWINYSNLPLSHWVGNTDTTHGNAVIAIADFMANMTRRAVPIRLVQIVLGNFLRLEQKQNYGKFLVFRMQIAAFINGWEYIYVQNQKMGKT